MDLVRLATTKNPSLMDPPVDDRMFPLKDLALKSTKGSGVATLEPYVPDPLPQRRRKNIRVKDRENELEIMCGVFEQASSGKFFTLNFDQDQRVQDLDMCAIEREIVDARGREPNMTSQSYGSLLTEVATPEESVKLQALAMLNGTPAKCSLHRSFNQCKCDLFYPSSEIL